MTWQWKKEMKIEKYSYDTSPIKGIEEKVWIFLFVTKSTENHIVHCTFWFRLALQTHDAPRVTTTILDEFPRGTSGFGGVGGMRRSGKGVTLQAGKTDYSDCRRVRLAGWATPSFWQRRIPLVMSSNERAFFILLASARYVRAFEKKKGREGGREQRRRKREKRNTKISWKSETVEGRKTRRV